MPFHFINRALLVLFLFSVHAPAQTTLPPLRITSSNGLSTVHWPLAGYSAVLQTATNLSPFATWTNLVTGDQATAMLAFATPGGQTAVMTNFVGDEMTFSPYGTNRQQFFRLASPGLICPCSYAIFYNGLLEFSQAATMIVNGRVHAEGPIYVGTSASLTLNAPVTTTSTLAAPLVDGLTNEWTPGNSNTWNVTFNGNPGYVTNAISLSTYTNNYHFLIDVPPAGQNPQTPPIHVYNEAEVVLLVTNGTGGVTNPLVQFILQSSYNGQFPGADPAKVILSYAVASPASLKTNLPFLSLTNSFVDHREHNKTNLVTQIDVGGLGDWLNTNATAQAKLPGVDGQYPTILYVADQRNVNAGQMAVVRLKNGAQLPFNQNLGFTVVTENPLYVWGNYNVQTPFTGPNASAGTTNTAAAVPAALMSDAFTILSPRWTDTESFSTYNNASRTFDAADMTVNAAIFTGSVASTGTDGTNFSGGVHNLPRLLEDWSGKNLWLNTSLVRLWDSQQATNQFRNPEGFISAPINPYYNPPTRHFSFDPKYLDLAQLPPGVVLISSP